MRHRLPILAWVVALVAASAFASDTTLRNDHITLVVQSPHGNHGTYGNARFDWSGIVGYVESRGHTYIGGKNPDGSRRQSLGTIGEFIDTLPLDDGGVRIGVGYVRGDKDDRTLVRALPWEIIVDEVSVTFHQVMPGQSGYAYEYAKRVALVLGEPAFTITHTLENTGTKPIVTRAYTHNWLLIDDTPAPGNGENYRVRFNYDIKPTKRNFPQLHMNLIGRDIVHDPTVPMAKGVYYAEFTHFEKVEENVVVVENLKTGASLRITGDWAPGWYHVYITKDEVCPEPFLQLDLKPGESRTWSLRYDCLTPAR